MTEDEILAEKQKEEKRQMQRGERYDWAEDATAQDILDAMRIVLISQDDTGAAMAVFKELLDWAPEITSMRGYDLLLRMISEGVLKVELKS